jgi:hypothetical protein
MSDERNDGNPNTRPDDREGGRIGQSRGADDIPAQGTVPSADLTSILAGVHYRFGPPTRPPITHDNGFLALGRRAPTAGDYAKLALWKAKLEAGEALRPDLTDGLGAYRHFLEGEGKPRTFSYERYVQNDTSGRTTLRNAILNIQWGVIQLWKASHKKSFSLTGTAIPCGSSAFYPYPATENWQKAIGGHQIWLSGDVTVVGGDTPDPADSKAGTHSYGSFSVTVAADGAIKVRPGDWLSKYSQALHNGDVTRISEYARMSGGKLVAIDNPDLILAGETLYHLPTHAYHQAAAGSHEPRFSLALTLHAEDRYNFNPNQHDIATGTPDADNGIFEMTGLAHQYDHFATLSRSVSWTGLQLGVGEAVNASHERQRQPDDNRRARNRV